ncbi:MAG TPA: GntR family transcriptional regulator [Rectinemataceae bacterium]|nr:GntR family transcriptional regulator [Rectinemataceae bacterium]
MAEEIRAKYRSIQDIVFTTLRDEIVSHTLKPGDIMNTVELSSRLGVSRTPIREALNRLISIGLVEEAPHRSCCVKKLSADQLIEIYYIRAALSGVAARLAATKISDADRRQLEILCEQMEKTNEPDESSIMLEKNREFHNIIIAAANSPRLKDILEQYYSQSQQYRALALELPGRFAEICAEHRKIAEALARGDKDGAEAYTREHYFNTARRIAQAFQMSSEI